MPFAHNDPSVYDQVLQMDSPRDPRAVQVRMIGRNKRVLELGCAGGVTTKALAEQGCAVVGVELDADAARRASEHAERVLVADLDAPGVLSPLRDERFDVVLAGDVLEHLRDPLAVLLAARELLDPDGFLVASMPNVAHADVRLTLLDGRFPYGPTGLLDHTHLRFFTLETIRTLLHEAGLVIVDLERLRTPIFTTELKPVADGVAPEIVRRVMQDPEAETYQFVLRAVSRYGDDARVALARRCESLTAEAGDVEAAKQQILLELDDANELVTELRNELGQVQSALVETQPRLEAAEQEAHRSAAESARLSDEVVALRKQVEALEGTKLYRATSGPRRVYARLRGYRLPES